MWSRAGVDGILYDLDVYQGGSGETKGILTRRRCRVKANINSSFRNELQSVCRQSVHQCTSTQEATGARIHYRRNRLPGCTLADEKSLKKRGRGSYDHKVEENHNIAAVRWYNRSVTLLYYQQKQQWNPLGKLSAGTRNRKSKLYLCQLLYTTITVTWVVWTSLIHIWLSIAFL